MLFYSKKNSKLTILIVSIVLSFGLSKNCIALSSDQNKPIELEADSADLNDKKGISIYTGDVVLTQGSTQLNASKLTLYHNTKHKLIKAVAIGSPARFKQRPDGEKQDVKAKASKMIYLLGKETIHLYDKAIFWQGKNSFSGDKISYDTKNDIVKASSKKTAGGKIKPTGRVKVTIQSGN